MSRKLMIKLDSYFGRIICFFLSIYSCLLSSNKDNKEKKDILIIKFFGIGSVSLTFPLLNVLNKSGTFNISFLTFSSNSMLLKYAGDITDIKTIRNDNLLYFFLDSVRAIRYFRKKRPSIIFDLEFFSRYTSILSFLIASPERYGFKSKSKFQNSLYSDVLSFDTAKHVAYNFYKMISKVGLRPDNEYLNFYYDKKNNFKDNKEMEISNKFSLDRKYILVNPNSSSLCYNRRWNPDNFKILLNKINYHYPEFDMIFIGSVEEKSYSQHIINSLDVMNGGTVKNLSGKTTIEELLMIIKKAELFITNDSGPMHLASLFQIKCISFFGPETPELYGPINKYNISFYEKELDCSPCLDVYDYKRSNCKSNICMCNIKPDKVYQSIEKMLA